MARYQKPEKQARRFAVKTEDDTTVQVRLQELMLARLSEWIPRLVRTEIREFIGRDSGERQQETEDPRAAATVPGASDKA